jgi:hypothetical protein
MKIGKKKKTNSGKEESALKQNNRASFSMVVRKGLLGRLCHLSCTTKDEKEPAGHGGEEHCKQREGAAKALRWASLSRWRNRKHLSSSHQI